MNMPMKLESPRFGPFEVDADKVIEFPRGLPGFEACHRFTLFHPEGDNPKYFILQSIDDVDVAFHIADPAQFGFTYEITLSDEETALIELTNLADAAVVVILFKEGDDKPLRANLNAPLVINLAARRGLQHTFAQLNYAVTLKSAE